MKKGCMLHKGCGRTLAYLLVLVLTITALPFTASADDIPSEEIILNNIIENYYKGEREGLLKNRGELVAVLSSTSYDDLKYFNLCDIHESGANSVIVSLIKGDSDLATEKVKDLIDGETLKITDIGPFGGAYNMIAIEAYNRSVEAEGITEIQYDKVKAVQDFIALQESDGGFGYGYGGDPDTTGISLLALSLYMDDSDEKIKNGISQSINLAIDFLKNNQQENGGYSTDWSGNNANSVALVISGLVAIGEDIGEWKTTTGKTPLDALLSFYVEDGGFGESDKLGSDDFATSDATMALASIVNGPFLKTFKINPKSLFSIRVQTVDQDGDYTERQITVSDDESVTDGLARFYGVVNAEVDALVNDYSFFHSGQLAADENLNNLKLEKWDTVLGVHNSFTSIAYLAVNTNDSISVLDETINLGDTIDLYLLKLDLTTNTFTSLPDIPIDINDDGYEDIVTDSDGKITITPITDKTRLSIMRESVYFDIDFNSSTITHLADTVALLPGVIIMNAGSPQSCIVSIRIEGKEKNILYLPSFEAENGGESLLTVYDAVIQAMANASIPYEVVYYSGQPFISSINGESESWLLLYNNISPNKGMGQIVIEEDAQIVLYNDPSNGMVNPDINIELIDGYLEMTFTADGNAISGIKIFWDGDLLKGMTDENGKIVITDVSPGSYTLQIEKVEDGFPMLLRLPPGYEIKIEDNTASGSTPPTPGENVAKVYITVLGPEGVVLHKKTAYTYGNKLTALDLLRRSGLRITYNDGSKTYVASIEGYEEFEYGPTSGWLFKVNNDESILSSAAAYVLEAGDSLVWFYTKDFTKESGSKKWSENGQFGEASITASEKEIKNVLEEIRSGKRNSWVVDLAEGSISFDKDALESLLGQMDSGSTIVSIEKAASGDLNSKQKEAVGERPVYEIKVDSATKVISQFAGKITISLPYILKAGEKPSGVAVYYLNDAGLLLPVEGYYNPVSRQVVFTVDHLSYYVIGYDEALTKWPFEDVLESDSANWYYRAIKYVYDNGIFSGMSETSFEPKSPITRAMLVTVLSRLSKADLETYSLQPFNDVKMGSWYGPSAAWAKETGIVSGYINKDGSYSFKPDDRITRQDISVMLCNYNEKVGKKTYEDVTAITFSDEEKISGYALSAVKEMQEAGIINGFKNAAGGYDYRPLNSATRAEAATLICNMMTK